MHAHTDKSLYSAIDLLRFPMIAAVVLIHCNFLQYLDTQNFDIAAFRMGYGIFKTYMLDLCVPAFFAISGFMYFRDGAAVAAPLFVDKARCRWHSLVVPYLLWNVAGLAVFTAKRFLLDDSTSMHGNFDFSPAQIAAGFFMVPGGPYPYDFPLWYVRNLILITMVWPCIPMLSLMLRHCKAATPVAFAIMALMAKDIDTLHLTESLTYFSFGAWLSIYGRPLLTRRRALPAAGVYIALAAAHMMWFPQGGAAAGLLYFVICAAGITLAIQTAGIMARSGMRIPRTLASSTFFVYAFHGLFCAMVCKTVIQKIAPSDSILCVADAIIIYTIVAGISLAAYFAALRIAPRAVGVLCGTAARRRCQPSAKTR